MLTERKTGDAEAVNSKPIFLWDHRVRGLGVKITPAGTGSYVLNYRVGGRRTPGGTGAVPGNRPARRSGARRPRVDGDSSFAPVAGNGRMAAGPDIGRTGPEEAGAGRRITALVKWFMPMKGYGFLEPEDGSPDVFCHLSTVEASGRDTLPQGAVVTCEIAPGERGPQLSRILSSRTRPPSSGQGT